MDRLQGKVAVVTGAAQGIGAAVVDAFAVEGATVMATDVRPVTPGEGIRTSHLDVTDADAWEALVTEVLDVHGRIDVLVNNAGIIAYAPIGDITLDEWQRVIAVDQTGVWLGMQAVVPTMRDQGAGSIVNLSSAWGVVGGVGVAAYQAAKGAVRSLTRNAAVTYAPDAVRVNTVVPGWIRTPLTDAQPADANDRVLSATPMGRGAEPSEIAAGCVFLASDESSFMTGADLVIDGGLLAR